MNAAPLLEVENLRLSIRTDEGTAEILDHVQLRLPRGRILGVVGESGCGKSTLVKAILGILPDATTIESGNIWFEGEDLLTSERARPRHGASAAAASASSRRTPIWRSIRCSRIGTQLLSVMRWHAPVPPDGPRRGAALMRHHRARLVEILRRVQMPEPEAALERYPHQFSGGQRQRLMIAGAIACSPRLLIADEPTTALDVTTQLQILKLLKSLAEEFAISMLFVSHDFGVVAQLCDEITVMYAGQTVESGSVGTVLAEPKHPYTRALLACHPERSATFEGIPGRVPSPLRPPPGCRFAPRCQHAVEACRSRIPAFVDGGDRHLVNCRLAEARSEVPA